MTSTSKFPDNTQVWLVGSHLHGLATADSDEDYTGVYHDREAYLDPLRDRDATRTYDDNNVTLHTAAKFARLIVKGNPSIIDLVYNAPLQSNDFVAGLITAVQPYAITQDLARSYMGYANEQFRRGFKPSTPQNANRKAQSERDGYDAKYVMHLCRLIACGIATLNTKDYHVLSWEEKARFIEIRNATYTKESTIKYVTGIMSNFEEVYKLKMDTLPENEELRRAITEYFIANA